MKKLQIHAIATLVLILSAITPIHAATLLGISVSGPNSVNENTTVAMSALAVYNPTTSNTTVTSTATWAVYEKNATGAYVPTAAATIAPGGTFTAKSVNANLTVYVTASYGGLISAYKSVQIIDLASGSHAGRFTAPYSGSKSCQSCHLQQTKDVFSSLHYQWENYSASKITNKKTGLAYGKRKGINGFCGYVGDINWLGKLTSNATGLPVDAGCARCHVGMGALPSATASQAQYDNIDCLICHSEKYKRTVVKNTAGSFVFAPLTSAANGSSVAMASDIIRVSNNLCLNCHIKAGGGNNFKRGTLGETMRNPTRDQEVHLSKTGAALSCTACHTVKGHHMAGVGADLPSADSSVKVSCQTTTCHPTLHATNAKLTSHAKRIACQTCHIPYVAATDPTDMFRRYDMPATYNATTGLYEPYMEMASNVTPTYAFFDGKVKLYHFGDATATATNAAGEFIMVGPTATIASVGAKITPFRLHQTQVAVDASDRMLPLKIGNLFQSGDIATAYLNGIAGVGWTYTGYTFKTAKQYMAVDHGVLPKTSALGCTDCHYGATKRMNLQTMGYAVNALYNGKPVCASCHSDRSNVWAAGQTRFTNVHAVHVDSRGYNCNVCHAFSKAP